MAVRIRLNKIGKRHTPYYRIVAMDHRAQRDGQALEILGTYNPRTSELLQFHDDRIQAWLKEGARLSNAARRLRKQYHRQQQPAQ